MVRPAAIHVPFWGRAGCLVPCSLRLPLLVGVMCAGVANKGVLCDNYDSPAHNAAFGKHRQLDGAAADCRADLGHLLSPDAAPARRCLHRNQR